LNAAVRITIDRKPVSAPSNLSKTQRDSIRSLKLKRHLLWGRAADKGLGFTLSDRAWVHSAIMLHLNDALTYTPLPGSTPADIISLIRQRLAGLSWDSCRAVIPDAVRDWILLPQDREDRIAKFYILAKLSKLNADNPFAARPISANFASPTRAAGLFIAMIMEPIIRTNGFTLLDTRSAVNLFATSPAWTGIGTDDYIVSFDAISLYTTLPLDGTREAAVELLMEHLPVSSFKLPFIHLFNCLLKVVLEHAYVQHDGLVYKQHFGLGMGLSCACQLANQFIFHLTRDLFRKWTRPEPPCLLSSLCYIDDGLGIWRGSEPEWRQFMVELNSLSDSVKFTTVFSKESVTFLDLQLFKHPDSDRLVHRAFSKPLSLHQFIPALSAHNPQCLRSFVFGESLRLARNCSFEADFISAVSHLKGYLLQRGYALFTVLEMTTKVSHSDRTRLLLTQPRPSKPVTPVLLVYHAQFHQLGIPRLVHQHLADIRRAIAQLVIAWKNPRNLQAVLGIHN
jgi:hypothetical protein